MNNNKSKGFIKVPREVFSLPFWRDPWDTTLWFYCALRVAYRRYGSIKAGQFYSSKGKIAQDLNWSWNGLTKHLDSLQRCGCIDVVSSPIGICITLKHWPLLSGATTVSPSSDDEDDYVPSCDPNWSLANEQGLPLPEIVPHQMDSTPHMMKTDTHPMDKAPHQTGSEPRATETDTHPMKTHSSCGEDIQEEKKEKTHTQTQNSAVCVRESEFDSFWDAYPRHDGGEDNARVAFMSSKVPFDVLMSALECAKQSPQWLMSNGRFIPNAIKWLDGGWRDCVPKGATVQQESGEETADDIIRRERAQWKRV